MALDHTSLGSAEHHSHDLSWDQTTLGAATVHALLEPYTEIHELGISPITQSDFWIL